MMRVYQTMGLAFIFIPINTLSYVGMPPNKSNQVSGITNLSRNLGGSIGISMLSTFLLRLAQRHQVYLSAHTGAGNPIFQSQIAGLTKNFSSQGAPPDQASERAYAMVQRMIAGQASTLAYIDIISTGAIAVACLAPLVFIMKKPRRGAKAAAAH
jgi:DHA2 family multidrug resistance protein